MAPPGPHSPRRRKAPKPLDETALKDLALAYVARFSTSSAKLEAYLARKLRERGTAEDGAAPDIPSLVARLVELGYVDDAGYARMKAGGLLRRGYGARRVEQTLRAAGIEEEVRANMRPREAEAREAALLLARRRGFGPFGRAPLDPARREKQIAAMVRAGHDFDAARAVIGAASEDAAEEWAREAEDEEW